MRSMRNGEERRMRLFVVSKFSFIEYFIDCVCIDKLVV